MGSHISGTWCERAAWPCSRHGLVVLRFFRWRFRRQAGGGERRSRRGWGIGNDALNFDPNPLDFGNLALNSTAVPLTITARNTSKVSIILKTFTAPTLTEFNVTGSTCTVGRTLGVNETCGITVTFNPVTQGTLQDKILISFSPVIDQALNYSNSANMKGSAIGPLTFPGLNTILSADVTTTKVILRWPSVDGASSYQIHRISGGVIVQTQSAPASATSYTWTSLTPNTNYTFRANALNILGVPDSNTNNQSVTTDNSGWFNAMPALAVNEG